MKERPILFSGPMVQAILEGRKTQTRRVIPGGLPELPDGWHYECHEGYWGACRDEPLVLTDRGLSCHAHCLGPYGAPGDHLWVRETWAPYRQRTITRYPDGSPKTCWCSDGEGDPAVLYRADMRVEEGWTDKDGNVMQRNTKTTLENVDAEKWKPSIFMPRWASRLLLEITEVRVERLQEITAADALAEGIEDVWPGPEALSLEHIEDIRGCFRSLWDSINGRRPGYSWQDNPWVFVVEFRRVE